MKNAFSVVKPVREALAGNVEAKRIEIGWIEKIRRIMEYTDLLVVKEYKLDEGIQPSAIRLQELCGIYFQATSQTLPNKTYPEHGSPSLEVYSK